MEAGAGSMEGASSINEGGYCKKGAAYVAEHKENGIQRERLV